MSHTRLIGTGRGARSAPVRSNSLHAAPPTCTTHFFRLVRGQREVLARRASEALDLPRRLGALGITPGRSAGACITTRRSSEDPRRGVFDGLHYEWTGGKPKPQLIEALRKTNLPRRCSNDMEIHFSGRPEFITPTEAVRPGVRRRRRELLPRRAPRLWLHDRNGRLPVVVYGYAFDRKVTDPAPWTGSTGRSSRGRAGSRRSCGVSLDELRSPAADVRGSSTSRRSRATSSTRLRPRTRPERTA